MPRVPVCVQLLQQLFGISLRLSWHCNKDEHKLLTRFLAQEINASATLQAERHYGEGCGGCVSCCNSGALLLPKVLAQQQKVLSVMSSLNHE